MAPDQESQILLVDDQAENLVTMEAVLTGLGPLVAVRSGKEALKQVLEREFAIILMDVRMPGMDGLETATLIRQRDRSRHTPIIFMTAYGRDNAEVSRGYALGAVDYIFKPLGAEVLRSKVAVFVDLFKKTKQLERLNEDLKRQRIALESSVQQLNAVMENVAEAVVVVDVAGGAVLRNRAARDMADPDDTSARGLLGREPGDVLGLDGIPIPIDQWPVRLVLKGEMFLAREAVLVRADGSRRRLAFSGSPVRDANGNVALGVLVCHDVTQLRHLEQVEEYVSLIAHDLRGSLTPLKGTTQWLGKRLSEVGMEREAKMARLMVTSAERLDSMIQELVDTARLEAGLPHARWELIDVRELVEGVSTRVGTFDEQRRIQVHAPDSLPPVRANREHIERLVTNLLTNALKYSGPGDPVIVRMGEQEGDVMVSVMDQGAGVTAEEKSHLFERFYRSKTTAKSEGLGLGLYICLLIIAAHRGRIWVDSEPGRGSTFTFTLPVAGPG